MLPLSSLYSHTENDSKGSKGSSAKAGSQFESRIGYKNTLVYLILLSFMAQFLVAPVVSAGVVG